MPNGVEHKHYLLFCLHTEMTSNAEPKECLKKFVFSTDNDAYEDEERLEVVIPELMQPGYSFYTWPSATVLAWFLWVHRQNFIGKRILEIGCGTGLPGIVASKFGANVVLSDSCILPNTLKHINRCCEANNLEPGADIQVMGLSWGILLKSVFDIGPLDYIIAADCFYDPTVFEDILVTVSFLLGNGDTRGTKFIFTYQERSADWSIEHLLAKWNLQCSNVCLRDVEDYCPLDIDQLMNGHTIRLMEVTRLR